MVFHWAFSSSVGRCHRESLVTEGGRGDSSGGQRDVCRHLKWKSAPRPGRGSRGSWLSLGVAGEHSLCAVTEYRGRWSAWRTGPTAWVSGPVAALDRGRGFRETRCSPVLGGLLVHVNPSPHPGQPGAGEELIPGDLGVGPEEVCVVSGQGAGVKPVSILGTRRGLGRRVGGWRAQGEVSVGGQVPGGLSRTVTGPWADGWEGHPFVPLSDGHDAP